MLDFNKLIERHIAREFKPKTMGRYYPSEIGSCLRKVWYSYKFPLPTDMERQKIFEMGNIMHHFIADVIRSKKNVEHVELLEEELPFKLEFNGITVSGRIDDLMLIKENSTKLLVEVKSTSSLSMTDEAQPTHVMQLQLYMHALKLTDGCVLYIEKNTMKCKAFYVKYDEKVAAEALYRFQKLHDYLTKDKLIEPEARLISEINWMCKYCEYRDRCFRDTPDSELNTLKFR
jgi:CRISPR/Cas system-associated exonuclease Cas4 (RecB family)